MRIRNVLSYARSKIWCNVQSGWSITSTNIYVVPFLKEDMVEQPCVLKLLKRESPWNFRVEFSRISQDYTNRIGCLSMHSMSVLSNRASTFSKSYEDERTYLEETQQFFLARFSVSIHPLFYKHVLENKKSFVIEKQIGKVGNKSLLTICTTQTNAGQVLAEYEFYDVMCDMVTRKSIPLPQRMREALSLQQMTQAKCLGEDLQVISADAIKEEDFGPGFHTRIQTRFSDSDVRDHINFQSYIVYFEECANAASLAGHYRGFTLDMVWYPSLQMDIIYVNECFANEELDMMTKQHNKDDTLIYFTLKRKDKLLSKALFRYDTKSFPDNLKSFL